MSYQVFARKYRPQTFEDLVGQEHVVRTLRNAIDQNRLAHAYLFVGPRGVGKTSTARILAKALNCPGGPKADFDPNDEICQEIAEGRCLDVLEIDGASNNGVEQVRELRDNVKFAPSRCPFKIYIIDEVHMLTVAAFNALLKTLEEPPPHVKFVFATTEPHKVLPTILSRCQRFDLGRISTPLISEHLLKIAGLENIHLSERAAYSIAKAAEGGLRDAESMLDQLVAFCGEEIRDADVLNIFGLAGVETVAGLAGEIIGLDTGAALRSLHNYSEEGKDLMKLLGDLIGYLRNLLILRTSPDSFDEDVAPDLVDVMKQQAEEIETQRLLLLIEQFAETEGRMKWATNKRLHFEVAVIKAIHTLTETSLSDVIRAISGIEAPSGGPGEGGNLPEPRKPRVIKPAADRAETTEPMRPKAQAPAPKPTPAPQVEKAAPPAPAPTPAPAPAKAPPQPAAVPEPIAKPEPVVESEKPAAQPVKPVEVAFGNLEVKRATELSREEAAALNLDDEDADENEELRISLNFDDPDQGMLFDFGDAPEDGPDNTSDDEDRGSGNKPVEPQPQNPAPPVTADEVAEDVADDPGFEELPAPKTHQPENFAPAVEPPSDGEPVTDAPFDLEPEPERREIESLEDRVEERLAAAEKLLGETPVEPAVRSTWVPADEEPPSASVAETTPRPAAEPAPQAVDPAPAQEPAAPASAVALSVKDLWNRLLQRVQEQEQVIPGYLKTAQPQSLVNGRLLVGFHTEDDFQLDRFRSKIQMLQEHLVEISGENIRLETELRGDLPPIDNIIQFQAGNGALAPSSPQQSAGSGTGQGSAADTAGAPAEDPEVTYYAGHESRASEEILKNFMDDMLIQKALDLFGAEAVPQVPDSRKA